MLSSWLKVLGSQSVMPARLCKQCCLTCAGPLKAEALVPFLSAYIKGAAANGSAPGSDPSASADASMDEPSPEADAGAGNDTTSERPEPPQPPPPDLYDLDMDKVDTLLEDDRVWMIATYAGEHARHCYTADAVPPPHPFPACSVECTVQRLLVGGLVLDEFDEMASFRAAAHMRTDMRLASQCDVKIHVARLTSLG